MNGIWVLTEHRAGHFEPVSFELLAEARRVASTIGTHVAAVVHGHDLHFSMTALAHFGAQTVFALQDDRLRHYDPELLTSSMAALCAAQRPGLILLPQTSTGADLAARLSATCRWPLVPRCIRLLARDGTIELSRALAGGKIHGITTCGGEDPQLATVAPDTLGLERPDPARVAETVFVPAVAPQHRKIELCGFVPGNPRELDLKEAEIVVAVGRGLGSRENLHQVEELADVLGATIGCTRPVVDLGWLPHAAQIGQTGTTVKPKLYLALGISGSTQHTIGMKDADTILAVNVDPGAPIFNIADMGLVADINHILPCLINRCRTESESP